MTELRVVSPLLHDGKRYEAGDLIDVSLLSEGQSDVLLAAQILAPVDDTQTEPAPPAAVEPAAVEPVAVEPTTPAPEAEPAAEAEAVAEPTEPEPEA